MQVGEGVDQGEAQAGPAGMILGAAYMLWLYRRVIFGKLEKEDLKALLDLSPREIAIFLPLVAIVMWMGIYPSSFTSIMAPSVDKLVQNYQAATHQTAAKDGAAEKTAAVASGTQVAGE